MLTLWCYIGRAGSALCSLIAGWANQGYRCCVAPPDKEGGAAISCWFIRPPHPAAQPAVGACAQACDCRRTSAQRLHLARPHCTGRSPAQRRTLACRRRPQARSRCWLAWRSSLRLGTKSSDVRCRSVLPGLDGVVLSGMRRAGDEVNDLDWHIRTTICMLRSAGLVYVDHPQLRSTAKLVCRL